MYIVVLLLCIVALTVGLVQEAPDGSVCFNNCNGHGDCIDYSCHCHAGYHGDDCGTTFADESHIVPILSAGHFNLTRKNFTQTITKNKIILVGFSSYNCHRCIQAEVEYEKIAERLKELKIPFARADADKTKSLAAEFGATELPSLVLFNKQRPVLYKGVHSADAVVTYIRKQIEKPAKVLKTVEDVNAFVASRNEAKYSVSTVMVVGFFAEHEDVEEDDYNDFLENAKELQSNEDVYFGVVTNPATCEWFKKNKTIDRTPSMMVVGESEQVHTINLDELFGDKMGIKEWVLKKSIPLVGKMTTQNFQLYNKIGLPMLMLFLDLTHELATTTPKTVGGKSGGIFNEVLLDEFKLAAREHVDRILFVYLDGTLYQDQMKSLGLFGGKERLPSLAFNTRDGSQIAFPEELSINKDTLLQFCAEFISGKLRNANDVKEMAKKALQTVIPINTKNKAERQKVKEAPEVVRGVSEQFGDGNAGDDAVVAVTNDNFNDIVLNEDKDVVLLLHSRNCEPCSHFAVYYKRMAERFRDLAIPTLVIAQMDVGTYVPPAHLNLIVGPLPIVAMVPSNNKHPPWTFYSGIGKVYSMMKWVHQQSSMPFDLPNLAHLTPKDREAYKTQVREREEALDAKRREDERAMAAEDRERAEVARRRRKEERQQQKEQREKEAAAAAAASTASGGEGEGAAKVTSIEVMPAGDIDRLDDSDEF